MKPKTLEMLRKVISAATVKESKLAEKGEDDLVVFLMRRVVAFEIFDLKQLTQDRGMYADIIVGIMEEIHQALPMSTDEEIVRMTKSKFKIQIGFEPCFPGHDDYTGIMLARYLRLQKQLREYAELSQRGPDKL